MPRSFGSSRRPSEDDDGLVTYNVPAVWRNEDSLRLTALLTLAQCGTNTTKENMRSENIQAAAITRHRRRAA